MKNQFEETFERRLNEMPHDLQHWIRIATLDLGRVPQWRIAEEIEAHYVRSYEEALASGRDEVNAHLIATDALGDPRKARKEFRKRNLTRAVERDLCVKWVKDRLGARYVKLLYGVIAIWSIVIAVMLAMYVADTSVASNPRFWRLAVAFGVSDVLLIAQTRCTQGSLRGIALQSTLNEASLFLIWILILEGAFAVSVGVLVTVCLLLRGWWRTRKTPQTFEPHEWEMLMSDCEWWVGERTAIRKWESKHGRRIWE